MEEGGKEEGGEAVERPGEEIGALRTRGLGMEGLGIKAPGSVRDMGPDDAAAAAAASMLPSSSSILRMDRERERLPPGKPPNSSPPPPPPPPPPRWVVGGLDTRLSMLPARAARVAKGTSLPLLVVNMSSSGRSCCTLSSGLLA